MPLIEIFDADRARGMRRKPHLILTVIDEGPSPRGSTYWGRVQHCGREHLLSNKLGWRSLEPSDPLDTGLIWHACLEAFYRERLEGQREMIRALGREEALRRPEFFTAREREAQTAAFDVLLPFRDEPGYDLIFTKIEKMLGVYFSLYRFDRWEILAVEQTLSAWDVEYTSKLDLIIIDHGIPDSPVLRGVEHKSAFRLTLDVLEGYMMDSQVLGQLYLLYRTFANNPALPPFAGSIVNIASKEHTPKLERVFVAPDLVHLRSWEEHILVQAEHRQFHEARGYGRNYGSCSRRFGRCEHFNFCKSFPFLTVEQIASNPPPDSYEVRPYSDKVLP